MASRLLHLLYIFAGFQATCTGNLGLYYQDNHSSAAFHEPDPLYHPCTLLARLKTSVVLQRWRWLARQLIKNCHIDANQFYKQGEDREDRVAYQI